MGRPRRPKPPESLDRLRALLDEAAVHRVLIPLGVRAGSPENVATILGIPLSRVVISLLADVEGDRVVALVPADQRLDLGRLAAGLGAKGARLVGAEPRRGQAQPPPAMISGLPTVIDRSLLRSEYLFGTSGDPGWVVKMTPAEVRRATKGIVADIVRTTRESRPSRSAPTAMAGLQPSPDNT